MVGVTELMQMYPRIGIIVFALAISLFISLINYFFMDKDRMKEIRAKQKDSQKRIREHQKAGEMDKAMALQKELMADMPEMLKHSFKPMLITFIPVIIFFSFVKGLVVGTAVEGTWFWWYLGGALVGSLIFRKILKLP